MKDSKIEWCDHTFNPWEGCSKVSPGCAHCYAEARNARWGGGIARNWGPGRPRRRTTASNWRKPIAWNRDARLAFDELAAVHGAGNVSRVWHNPRVFCASLADWLDDEVPIEWLADLLGLIESCTSLDWLLLTKRPENFYERMADAILSRPIPAKGTSLLYADWRRQHVQAWLARNAHVWIGISAENQECADRRLPILRTIPAAIRFASCEPLLGPVSLFTPATIGAAANASDTRTPADWWIDWVIVGGESGAGARPFALEWARSLVQQCTESGVACFVKQLGARPTSVDEPQAAAAHAGDGSPWRLRLKDSKGGDLQEWPEEFRVRQFPQRRA
jgi:protein gp37